MDCIICKLINGEIPVYKVYEDEKYMAFLDINPSSPGHTMVVPKKHIPTLFVMTEEEMGEIFERVKKISLHIKDSALQPVGFNIGINHLRAAGQEIDHLHIHIIPRWPDDNGGAVQTIVKNKEKMSLEEILEKIKM